MFSPCGDKVLSLFIQKSSCNSRILLLLGRVLFSNFSMIVNLASVLKLWSCDRKCCSTGSKLRGLGDVILYLYKLILRLNFDSDLPTYCILHLMHSSKYMRLLLLQSEL